jgi:hypothetical protein
MQQQQAHTYFVVCGCVMMDKPTLLQQITHKIQMLIATRRQEIVTPQSTDKSYKSVPEMIQQHISHGFPLDGLRDGLQGGQITKQQAQRPTSHSLLTVEPQS